MTRDDMPAAFARFTPPPRRRTTHVEVVTCPSCNGEGTTPGPFSYYGMGVESCERCHRCGGRRVIEREVES
jgi:DnaJ-class molecular chaperone